MLKNMEFDQISGFMTVTKGERVFRFRVPEGRVEHMRSPFQIPLTSRPATAEERMMYEAIRNAHDTGNTHATGNMPATQGEGEG
jgi:hypothetical protein